MPSTCIVVSAARLGVIFEHPQPHDLATEVLGSSSLLALSVPQNVTLTMSTEILNSFCSTSREPLPEGHAEESCTNLRWTLEINRV